eukprot:2010700-Pleurochrysis_carterae.AAC.4
MNEDVYEHRGVTVDETLNEETCLQACLGGALHLEDVVETSLVAPDASVDALGGAGHRLRRGNIQRTGTGFVQPSVRDHISSAKCIRTNG